MGLGELLLDRAKKQREMIDEKRGLLEGERKKSIAIATEFKKNEFIG